MSGGGKGGSQSSSVQLPGFINDAAERAVARGEQAGSIGFVPFSGPDVAAFSPSQEAAFAGTNQAASAFGLPTSQGTGLPEAQEFAGGLRGFSSKPLLDEAIATLGAERPGQLAAIQSGFIDPVTGAPGQGLLPRPSERPASVGLIGSNDNGFEQPNVGSSGGGGFVSVRDMFDGGGAGASGGNFQGGGLLSDFANARADRRAR